MTRSRYPVHSLDTIKARLAAVRATGLPRRHLAAGFPGGPAGTLCAIAKGREPHKGTIRAALGLPVLAPAPVCIYCGVPHTTKRCTAKQVGKPRKPSAKKIIMAA